MRFLIDEQLDPDLADVLTLLGRKDGDEYSHMEHVGMGGLADEDIPDRCSALGVYALITANVRDFGARLALYEALTVAGVSVIVLRPGKGKFRLDEQTYMLSRWRKRIRHLLATHGTPILVKVTPSDVRAVWTLEDLVDEFGDPRQAS